MPGLLSSALMVRRNDRLLRTLPPYLSLLCIVVGVVWLFMLPLDGYSRRTYISENALLPGQVHTYFGGSDQNVFRAYRHEIDALSNSTNTEVNDGLETILKGVGLKVGRQNFTYRSGGSTYAGENIYAILPAPRGDAEEAIVLVAPWRVGGDEKLLNRGGVALSLALARYFKRWSLWSKDILLVFPPDTRTGTQAWVDAYHDAHDPRAVSPLPLKSGALQGALALDYPQTEAAAENAGGGGGGRFESVHIIYDGVNGQLPNLDLINSVVNIANGQGQGSTLQKMWKHRNTYEDRLRTMLRGMLSQGLGHATGAHSSFIPYHVDAVTIQPVGRGWHDEMGLGRLVEGTFRSLNNLLEHLHQSFFFYLLMNKDRFVSIGTYLPSAMLVAANFTIMAISLWVRSGYKEPEEVEAQAETEKKSSGGGGGGGGVSAAAATAVVVNGDSKLANGEKVMEKDTTATATDTTPSQTAERHIFLPLGLVVGSHLLGAVPLFIFNHTPSNFLTPTFALFALLNAALPHLASHSLLRSRLVTTSSPTRQRQFYRLLKGFSLLLLGMFLSALATLNFSLALLVGLLAAPLTFTPVESGVELRTKAAFALLLDLISPPAVVAGAAVAWKVLGASGFAAGEGSVGGGGAGAGVGTGMGIGMGVGDVLKEAAFGWDVWGLYTPLIVWCVWWPAWLVGSVVVLSSGGSARGKRKTS